MEFNEALEVVPEGSDRHELRNFNFMNNGQPPSVKELAQRLGFEVELRSLPRGVSGFLESDAFGTKGFRIVINEDHSVVRRRWTVLHEIAHYYLHPEHTDPLAPEAFRADVAGVGHFYLSEELIEEREANEWVEAIVFEQSALKAAISMHGRNYTSISKIFGVSEQTLKIAIRNKI